MIPLAFAALAAGAVALIAGVTGSTIRSVAQGRPDHATAGVELNGSGEPASESGEGASSEQAFGTSEPGARSESSTTTGLGLTREQANAQHPEKAPPPSTFRKFNARLYNAELAIRQLHPHQSAAWIHQRAVRDLAIQAAGR